MVKRNTKAKTKKVTAEVSRSKNERVVAPKEQPSSAIPENIETVVAPDENTEFPEGQISGIETTQPPEREVSITFPAKCPYCSAVLYTANNYEGHLWNEHRAKS